MAIRLAPADWATRVKRGIVLGALVVVSLRVGQCASASDYAEDMAYWKGRVDVAVAESVRESQRADSLQSQIAEQQKADSLKTDSIRSLQARVNERRQNRRLAAVPDTCKPVVEALLADNDSLDAAVTSTLGIIRSQQLAIASLNVTVDGLQERNAVLVDALRNVPVHKGDKLLGFISLPSRTTSFIAGAVVGAAGVVAVLK